MEEVDFCITHFLADHDMPCDGCGYNLRGMEGLQCPECGMLQPYDDFDALVEYRRKHEILEVGEFRFVRQAGTLLSILLLIDAAVLGFGGVRFSPQPAWYWVIPSTLFLAAVGNSILLVYLFYSKRQYTTLFWSPAADRTRDHYGVFVMLAIVPVASMIVLIPMMM